MERTMANPERGEVSFEHEGKTYTLVMNTMALAKLQRHFNTKDAGGRDVIADIEEIDRLIKARSLDHIVASFWAALQKYHPEIATVEQAAELVDVAGARAVSALMEASGLGKIDPRDLEELAKGNPPTAQVDGKKSRKRRGATFTSMHAPPA
jgi:hypothetical protein